MILLGLRGYSPSIVLLGTRTHNAGWNKERMTQGRALDRSNLE